VIIIFLKYNSTIFEIFISKTSLKMHFMQLKSLILEISFQKFIQKIWKKLFQNFSKTYLFVDYFYKSRINH